MAGKKQPTFKIIPSDKNPSKADMIDAFVRSFDAKDAHVVFQMKDHMPHPVKINKIGYDDGSGQNLMFWGYLTDGTSRQVKGFYNCTNRSGWIEVGPFD